jgi:hypothetical protein
VYFTKLIVENLGAAQNDDIEWVEVRLEVALAP